MKRQLYVLVSLVCFLCLSNPACSRYKIATTLRSSNLRTYVGPLQPKDSVGYLACASSDLEIAEIDGTPTKQLKARAGHVGSFTYAELLPGEHTVLLKGSTTDTSYSRFHTDLTVDIVFFTSFMGGESVLSFMVEPGHVYVIHAKITKKKSKDTSNSAGHTLTISVEDVQTLKIVCLVESDIQKYGRVSGKRQLESIYLDGKSVFFTFLEDKIHYIHLNKKDKTFLLNEKYKKKGLYEHLMNFYFFLHDIDDKNEETYRFEFLRISEFMAEEFLQSIPLPYQKAGYSSINSMLVSSGYFSRKTAPQLRKFLRPLGKKVKNQDVFKDLNISKAHSLSKGAGVKIAIIDSGVDPTIKEIKGRIKNYKNFLDGSKPFKEKGTFPFDFSGHGTSVTTLINCITPRAELIIIKFYDTDRMKQAQPSRWTAYLAAAGMIWAVQNGADIINLSAAFLQDLWPIKQATQYCWDRNVIVVTPMGNSFDNNVPVLTYFPASYPWTIAVGGAEKTNGKLKVWEHSGKGDYVDIVAPAMDLWVELPSYLDIKLKAQKSFGNSLAVGFVTGASALILSAMDEDSRSELKNKPGRLCEEVRRIIRATASNEILGLSLPNSKSGYGMIEIQSAILLTLSQKQSKSPRRDFDYARLSLNSSSSSNCPTGLY